MREIYLIRHATPSVQPNVPSQEWALSPRGADEARTLATHARDWGLKAIYTSAEPKARSTALLLGDELLLPVHVVDGLEELRFDHWIANSDEFAEAVRSILEQPSLSFRGAETADAAAARFEAALDLITAAGTPAAVVTHGRVLSAWLARASSPEEAFAIWRAMPMPGWARIDLDALAAEEVSFQP
ncbi:MAG TPA: histidine phosphatase family protein [Gaiellaceae bacterium]|nr:histidine phosphatase family protein [Gaiellaceae bacterium]